MDLSLYIIKSTCHSDLLMLWSNTLHCLSEIKSPMAVVLVFLFQRWASASLYSSALNSPLLLRYIRLQCKHVAVLLWFVVNRKSGQSPKTPLSLVCVVGMIGIRLRLKVKWKHKSTHPDQSWQGSIRLILLFFFFLRLPYQQQSIHCFQFTTLTGKGSTLTHLLTGHHGSSLF